MKKLTTIQKILRIIAICGEVPRSEASWAGEEVTVKATLLRYKGVIQVSGKTDIKTIRGILTRKDKNASMLETIMNEIGDGCAEYWNTNYARGKITSSPTRVYRNHKMARTVIFYDECGIEVEPWSRARLGAGGELLENQFYTTREIRGYTGDRKSEYSGAQAMGFLVLPTRTFMTYYQTDKPRRNDTTMESRLRFVYEELAKASKNAKHIPPICTEALILSPNSKAAVEIAMTFRSSLPYFASTIRDVWSLRTSEEGKRLLRIWQTPNWEEWIRNRLWPDNYIQVQNRRDEHARIEIKNSNGTTSITHALLWLNGNLAVLRQVVLSAIETPNETFGIVCSKEQKEVVEQFLDKYADEKSDTQKKPIKVENIITYEIDLNQVEQWLGISGEEGKD